MQCALTSAGWECADRWNQKIYMYMLGKVCGAYRCALLHPHPCEALGLALHPHQTAMTRLCSCFHGQSSQQALIRVTLPSRGTVTALLQQ